MPTLTAARTEVRLLLDQTSTTDTQFSEDFIEDLLNRGRRQFASILPEKLLTGLAAGDTSDGTVTTGVFSYPADFLRHRADKRVLLGSGSATVVASQIPNGEEWRMKFLEANSLTVSSSTVKYYYETNNGVWVWPNTDDKIRYPYLKKPDDLDGSANTDLPPMVDDMVVAFAFEKCMNTQRGDPEVAIMLAKQRGIEVVNLSNAPR